ncbi:uncharacterized protein F4807DRAFT_467271 [Annulohypoxylon truncatum]|uniref:uncharacterized protein n=1 Tax=Annulohypoxylon truncatum TaxID=327061 RepID=UPI002008866D|nr:uncharacterized protein F4807DRAFT_467271 [Annulohypoxylon truncatum]KAI1210145.1 hypothetical protein F4807DRAFT_467271 [Annulohypoxylon truncatum]
MSFLHRLRRLVRTNEKRMIKIVKKQSSVATLVIDLLEERDEQAKVSSSKIQQLEQRNKELEERLETNQAEVQSVQIKGLKQETDRKIDSLLKENAQLRSEVGERESQIFSLQPYRQELTTDEARTEYKNLVSSIRGFVENWTSSLLRNPEIQKKSLSWAKNHRDNISHFGGRLARWKDLYDTARMTNIDIDQEILIAFILRFLQETLFKRRLTSLHPDMDSMMDFVDNSMRKSVDPKPVVYCPKDNRQFCFRHRVPWHSDYTCDEYDAFLQDPEHFRSEAQKQRGIYRTQELSRKRSRQEYEEAEERFTQSLLREEEAAEARRRARQRRIEEERRLAEERARLVEQERRAQEALQHQARLRNEETATNKSLHQLTKRCPSCGIRIQKNGGW